MGTLFQKDADVPSGIKIALLGDSITDNGLFIAFMDSYFAQHMPGQDITFINLGVSSETASGLSEPEHPFPRPCVHDRLHNALKESRPDWAVICYGMNDGIYHQLSGERFQAYKDGMLKAIRAVKQSGAKAIVMTPPPYDAASRTAGANDKEPSSYSWKTPFEGYNEVLRQYADWVLSLNHEADAVINIYDPLWKDIQEARSKETNYVSGDGIHPNARGHWIIAKTLLSRLFNISLERVPGYVSEQEQPAWFKLSLQRHRLLSSAWKEHVGHTNPNKAAAVPLNEALTRGAELATQIRDLASEHHRSSHTVTSVWKGYTRTDFYLHGREGILIAPKEAAPGRPWVWRAEFFGAFDYADQALLNEGWHIAYYRLSHMYGCPGAVRRMRTFQEHMEHDFQLAMKAALFGFSRGGLYAFNYAAAYPDKVSDLYLDAPVLTFRSWPGGKGSGPGTPANWEECLAVYGLTEQSALRFEGNPLDMTGQVVTAGIPILIVAGDADELVPFTENAAELEKRVREQGGRVKLIVKHGVGHHPHSLEDPRPIVDFLSEARQ